MAIRYESLDAGVRRFMVQELEMDLADSCLYVSPRLTDEGQRDWASLLREAIENHDDAWLADTIRSRSYMPTHEEQRWNNRLNTETLIAFTASTMPR